MNKTYRHEQVLNLIRQNEIRTQEELSQALRSLGVRVTQVTLSRDIKKMGLVKGPRGYQESASAAESRNENVGLLKRAISEYVKDVLIAQNLVVLRTVRGTAAPVSDAIDQEHWAEIVGTIAGEDTVFAATKDNKKALEIRDRLMNLLR